MIFFSSSRLLTIDTNDRRAPEIAASYGIDLINPAPDCSIILRKKGARQSRIKVVFQEPGNLLDLGPDDHLSGYVLFLNKDNTFVCEGSPNTPAPVKIQCRMASAGGMVVWGEGSTSNGVQIVTAGKGTKISVGRDCMFATEIWVRSSDMHGMFDLKTGELLNPSADVRIDDHVWIGQQSTLLKGTEIGRGSIVGAKSLVSGIKPANSLIAGSPAKVRREGVSWSRSLAPSPAEVARVRDSLDYG